MQNLLDETLRVLKKFQKTLDDIIWIGGDDFEISKEEFCRLADNAYDSGYGRQEVAVDLKLVGEDFWLERFEYDGAEGWTFKTLPTCPTTKKSITRIMGGAWDTLYDLNFRNDN